MARSRIYLGNATTTPPAITRRLKAYIGGVWVAKPVKYYMGGVWVEKELKKL